MIRVLFFAGIREQLATANLDIEWTEDTAIISQLVDQLGKDKGDKWKDVLSQDNIVTAVNQLVVDNNAKLNDGDELAFYPPVTGG